MHFFPEYLIVDKYWASELARVGWPQHESVACWWRWRDADHSPTNGWRVNLQDFIRSNGHEPELILAAPDADEIIERLPPYIKDKSGKSWHLDVRSHFFTQQWDVSYRAKDKSPTPFGGSDPFLANAAASMYVLLADKGLLPQDTHSWPSRLPDRR